MFAGISPRPVLRQRASAARVRACVGGGSKTTLAPSLSRSTGRGGKICKMAENTILIADDDKGLIRLLSLSLKPLGVKIEEAHDAMYALTIIHKSPPSLVILDVNMPAGNGLSACEMLASDPRLRRVPVIILTGDSSDATLMRCQRMRAHYVRKGPNAMNELKRLVCQLLSIDDTRAPAPASYHG
jgi:CheY-like chemotaxis protein